MNQTNFAPGVLAALLLTACGGGSSSAGTPAPSKLAAYVGSWVSPCEDESITTVTIADTVGIKDTVNHTYKIEFYALAGCTGAITATQTYSADITETHTGTADVGVVAVENAGSLWPSVMTRVDLVSRQLPPFSISFTGPDVIHKVENGVAMTCFGGGAATCSQDYGVLPGQAAHPAAIYRTGNKLVRVNLIGGIYFALPELTKK